MQQIENVVIYEGYLNTKCQEGIAKIY